MNRRTASLILVDGCLAPFRNREAKPCGRGRQLLFRYRSMLGLPGIEEIGERLRAQLGGRRPSQPTRQCLTRPVGGPTNGATKLRVERHTELADLHLATFPPTPTDAADDLPSARQSYQARPTMVGMGARANAKAIVQARRAAGLTQAELAMRSRTSQPAVNRTRLVA